MRSQRHLTTLVLQRRLLSLSLSLSLSAAESQRFNKFARVSFERSLSTLRAFVVGWDGATGAHLALVQ